jgi:ribonuclease HI
MIGICLRNQGDHLALDAELASILMVVHLVLTSDLVDEATTFSDSQAAIVCINGKAQGATQALLKAAKRALKQACNQANGMEVRLQWCLGHAGIMGNETADTEASAIMQGKTFHPSLLLTSL